jgi:hypothetical protein
LNLFRNVSVITDSWNNKNAFTTSRYWLEKLFLILDGYQKSRDPKKFCVKRIKYFRSDKAKSRRKRSERKYFYYGKSIKRVIKGICKQPEIHKHN